MIKFEKEENDEIATSWDQPKGRVYFWGERALYLGPGLEATVHAHYAVQVCLPLSGTVRLRPGSGTPWQEYEGAVIPSNQPHESDQAVSLITALFLDAETPEAQRLVQSRIGGGILPIEWAKVRAVVPRLLAFWNENPDGRRAAELLNEVVHTLASGEHPRQMIDPRVTQAVEFLRSVPERHVRLSEVAAIAFLSPSRFAHLFRAHMGIPIRRYLLWLRLRGAVEGMARGASLTEAAHAAGFADSAHFSRTFRRMLGFTPSALRQLSTFVQANPMQNR